MYIHVRYNVFCFSRSTVCLCARLPRRSLVHLLMEAGNLREHFHSTLECEPLPSAAHEYKIFLRKCGHQETLGALLVRVQGVHFRRISRESVRLSTLASNRSVQCWLAGSSARRALRTPQPPAAWRPPGRPREYRLLVATEMNGLWRRPLLDIFTGRD